MNRKLTQAVFEGLPPEYQWTAVDSDGEAFAYKSAPERWRYAWVDDPVSCLCLGSDFNSVNWQHSLIERQPDVMQAIAERLAAMKATIDKETAQLEMLIVSDSDRLNMTIKALEKKLELVTAQHDALVKNNADLCDLVKKREWISVAEELPPRHREVLVFTHEKSFLWMHEHMIWSSIQIGQATGDTCQNHRRSCNGYNY